MKQISFGIYVHRGEWHDILIFIRTSNFGPETEPWELSLKT